MTKPNFTDEELRYIETIFDLNASITGDKISKAVETFIFAKSSGNEEHCKALSKVIMELAETNLVTKSIRTKIENWRKEK
jgi:hypothetical protein